MHFRPTPEQEALKEEKRSRSLSYFLLDMKALESKSAPYMA